MGKYIDKEKLAKVRAEIERRKKLHEKSLINPIHEGFGLQKVIESKISELTYLLSFIDSMQEEPVKIKKGCKYRCLSDMINRDTGNIAFIGDNIYFAPRDNTLVSEEYGLLCDTSEDASNFELVEEPKKCMFTKDYYTDEDRKALCDGCKEECKFNKKEYSVNNGLDLGCGVIWRDEEPVSEDLEHAVNAYIGYAPEVDESSSTYGKRQAFKAGAKWQKQKDANLIFNAKEDGYRLGFATMKQQLMANAVDATVHIDAGGYPHIQQIELYDYDKDIPLAKEGDKYKVVLIKEE